MKNNQNQSPEAGKREVLALSDNDLERVSGGTGEPNTAGENPFGNIPRVPTQPVDPYLRGNG